MMHGILFTEHMGYEWNDETAERYARKYGDCATNRIPVDQIEFPPQANVVDIGCGTGATLRRVAQFISQGALIGIDPVPRMLEIAQEQTAKHPAANRIEFRRGSAENLPIDSGTADYVFAFDTFDFWGDKDGGLDEVRRVIRPDGWFVVVKDSDMSDATESGLVFEEVLARSDLTLLSKRFVEAEGVSFTIWVATLSG